MANHEMGVFLIFLFYSLLCLFHRSSYGQDAGIHYQQQQQQYQQPLPVGSQQQQQQYHQQQHQQYQQQQPPGQPPNQQYQQQQPGQPNQQQQQQYQPPVGGQQIDPNQQQQQQMHKFADDQELHDQQHIKSHLEGQVNVEQQMTNEQMQFHYFKMHDTNNDNMLDGVELIKAITHWHTENDQTAQPPKLNEPEMETMIDQILTDDDFNNDGFIEYSEFLKAQAVKV